MALVLDQADVQSQLLVYVFGVLAAVAFLGALAALIGPRIGQLRRVRFRWPLTLTPVGARALKLSRQEIAERSIRYRSTPIRLIDLLEVVGVDGAIMDFTFEHCILEGPGIITFRGPPPATEMRSGATGHLTVGPANCRVEGAPETTLYEIRPGGVERLHGVIQLVGPTIRNVTFRNLGFAGTPKELRQLREHLTFSEGVVATPEQENRELEAGEFAPLTVTLGTDERPLIEEDEIWESSYSHRSFWMGEFARKTARDGRVVVCDRRFYDCDVYGPVVFGPLTDDKIRETFVDCEWSEGEDNISWSPEGSERAHLGTVGLENCRFIECRMYGVGVLQVES